ncbi:hypothetical protein Bbelb_300180 [Branchiostoma belcheri]|nr:hypothetical protein Bbelb_300180 [Branchiostoma belcheri]
MSIVVGAGSLRGCRCSSPPDSTRPPGRVTSPCRTEYRVALGRGPASRLPRTSLAEIRKPNIPVASLYTHDVKIHNISPVLEHVVLYGTKQSPAPPANGGFSAHFGMKDSLSAAENPRLLFETRAVKVSSAERTVLPRPPDCGGKHSCGLAPVFRMKPWGINASDSAYYELNAVLYPVLNGTVPYSIMQSFRTPNKTGKPADAPTQNTLKTDTSDHTKREKQKTSAGPRIEGGSSDEASVPTTPPAHSLVRNCAYTLTITRMHGHAVKTAKNAAYTVPREPFPWQVRETESTGVHYQTRSGQPGYGDLLTSRDLAEKQMLRSHALFKFNLLAQSWATLSTESHSLTTQTEFEEQSEMADFTPLPILLCQPGRSLTQRER